MAWGNRLSDTEGSRSRSVQLRLPDPRAKEAPGCWDGALDRDDAVAESCAQALAMTNSSWPLRAWHFANAAEHAVSSDAPASHTQKNTTSVARNEAWRLR